MSAKPRFLVFGGIALAMALAGTVHAGDLHIVLNKRTKPTPVQRLNRQGVKAIEKHAYGKAKAFFYKAYLIDPNDPFTLNNLGYIAELEGDVERAQRFYALASEQPSDAMVDTATAKSVLGKPVVSVAGHTSDAHMRVNEMNVAAIALLMKERAPEADILLHRALVLDPKNPFTLNNLAYTEEKQGEWEKALSYYNQAAWLNSKDTVAIAINPKWRGRPISEVAAQNADNLRRMMAKQDSRAARIARLNLQGVSAINRNDPRAAREDFESAYKLDPNDAFTLNNMGYLAEMEGDRETANFFYEKAAAARGSVNRVDVATRTDAEGRRLAEVADRNNHDVDSRMQAETEVRRRQGGPIILKRRDQTPVTDTAPQPTQPTTLLEAPRNPM